MAKVADVRDGSEVSVETGLGWISKVDEPRGRNAKVEIRAEHLAKPVNCWADTADAPLYDLVRQACAEGARVSYRVVVKRKKDQPSGVPLAEIPTEGRIRDLEQVERAGGVVAPSTPTGPPPTLSAAAAQTPVAAPTPPTTRPEASEAGSGQQGPQSGKVCGLCHQPVAGGPPCRTVKGEVQHIECPGAVDESRADVPAGPLPSDPPRSEPTSPSTSNGSGPRMAEGKPWEFYNSDGSLNPGSYAYSAAEGIVLLANDLLLARARAAEGEFKPPTEGQVRHLARRLLKAADRAQANLRDDGHVARMASSHSRCRAAVRASLEVYPVPWLATSEQIDEWEDNLVAHAGLILRLTVELVDPEAAS